MDRLTAEVETEVKTQTEKVEAEIKTEEEVKEPLVEELVQTPPPTNSYLNSFENMTVADVKRQEEQKQLEEFEKEKEVLIAQVYEKTDEPQEQEQKPANIIEKPNYDLLEENKKIVRLTKKTKAEKKRSKKTAGIVLAAVLGASAIICVTNAALIDQFSSNYIEVEETYNFNLGKYLKDINNLDATKKSMEFLETYPDDMLDAGSIGEKSNWFDRLCNFLGGLFGG